MVSIGETSLACAIKEHVWKIYGDRTQKKRQRGNTARGSPTARQYIEFRRGLGMGLMNGLRLCGNHSFQGMENGQDVFWQTGDSFVSYHLL